MSRFRKAYRELTPTEQATLVDIKDSAEYLETSINKMLDCREKSLAMTKLEEAVMWAVKGVTG